MVVRTKSTSLPICNAFSALTPIPRGEGVRRFDITVPGCQYSAHSRSSCCALTEEQGNPVVRIGENGQHKLLIVFPSLCFFWHSIHYAPLSLCPTITWRMGKIQQ